VSKHCFFENMEKEVPVNRYVRLQDGRIGMTKFFGYIHGKRKRFVGIELLNGEGKHNGIVHGMRYFKCKDGHGIMTRPNKVEKIYPARTKKWQIREENRLRSIFSQFPAVGKFADKVKSATQALVHAESNLNGIFDNATLHLIFEFSGFLMEVDMSAYKGKYTFRVQRGGGSEVKDWNVSMTLQANGMYEIIGYQSSVGFTRTPDYHEKGHFDHLPGEGRYVTLQFNSEDTQGDRGIGKLFHGSFHHKGSKIKRTMQFKDVERFRDSPSPF